MQTPLAPPIEDFQVLETLKIRLGSLRTLARTPLASALPAFSEKKTRRVLFYAFRNANSPARSCFRPVEVLVVLFFTAHLRGFQQLSLSIFLNAKLYAQHDGENMIRYDKIISKIKTHLFLLVPKEASFWASNRRVKLQGGISRGCTGNNGYRFPATQYNLGSLFMNYLVPVRSGHGKRRKDTLLMAVYDNLAQVEEDFFHLYRRKTKWQYSGVQCIKNFQCKSNFKYSENLFHMTCKGVTLFSVHFFI